VHHDSVQSVSRSAFVDVRGRPCQNVREVQRLPENHALRDFDATVEEVKPLQTHQQQARGFVDCQLLGGQTRFLAPLAAPVLDLLDTGELLQGLFDRDAGRQLEHDFPENIELRTGETARPALETTLHHAAKELIHNRCHLDVRRQERRALALVAESRAHRIFAAARAEAVQQSRAKFVRIGLCALLEVPQKRQNSEQFPRQRGLPGLHRTVVHHTEVPRQDASRTDLATVFPCTLASLSSGFRKFCPIMVTVERHEVPQRSRRVQHLQDGVHEATVPKVTEANLVFDCTILTHFLLEKREDLLNLRLCEQSVGPGGGQRRVDSKRRKSSLVSFFIRKDIFKGVRRSGRFLGFLVYFPRISAFVAAFLRVFTTLDPERRRKTPRMP
jgi:hypothetical protein